MIAFALTGLSIFLLGSVYSPALFSDDGDAYFESKVRPLLIEHCFRCHGGTNRKGGLSLATRRGWEKGGESGPVIVRGRPEESPLLQSLRHEPGVPEMPPQGKLKNEEIAVIEEWIQRGAPDPREEAPSLGGMSLDEATKWWSFQPIHLTHLPNTNQPTNTNSKGDKPTGEPMSANAIDAFLESAAHQREVPLEPMADRRTLLRRATYDLTGLPPTMEEWNSFEQDVSPEAFAKVVDRLLESPHYGEHWGRKWLDVVRYADTAGENTDRPLPEMWRYRNWVFQSFQDDMPFDLFVKLQIAGDLLRSGAQGKEYQEGIIATGYLALARRFGHDCDQENHLMYEDVIDNLGKGFLGLTLSCARCHDHKYDPFTAADYYALYGILDSSRFSFSGCEAKGAPRDLVPIISTEEINEAKSSWLARRTQALAAIEPLEKQLAALGEAWKSRWNDKRNLLSADVAEAGSLSLRSVPDAKLDSISVRQGEVLLLVVAPRGNHGADSTQVKWDLYEEGGKERRWSTDELVGDLLQGNPHASKIDEKPTWMFLDLQSELQLLDESVPSLEGKGALQAWRRGDTPSVFVNRSDETVQVWTGLPPKSFFVHPGPKGPVAVAWISPIDGNIRIEGNIRDAHPAQGLDGVAVTIEHIPSIDLGKELLQVAALQAERRMSVRAIEQNVGPEPSVPEAFGVIEGAVRNAKIQLQGSPEKLGDEVPRGWVSLLGGDTIPTSVESGRRELAEWIAMHPLATRVIVNRVWQGHFGTGLVRSVNDFGSRGESPSHPELLEWLCSEFQKDGMRIKALHRRIMLSRAYQRSSLCRTESLLIDPDNRIQARFHRRRLSAEEIRDSILFIAGTLDRTTGEAHPFPPKASWNFTQHTPFNAVYQNHRRTVYQMVQRQRRHPFLALFDGADPNASTGIRQTTTVPTQSLYFLNDPFFHEQAAALASSTANRTKEEERLTELWRRVLLRVPDESERKGAEQFLSSYPASREEAWAAYSRLLLASNEFLHLD